MRHLVWLSGCLLVLSCSLDRDNLTPPPVDAGGSGGATVGCPRCVASGGTTGGGSGGAIGSGGVRAMGTGGAVTTGGDKGTNDGGESCADLESDYAKALTDAENCTADAQDQCQQLIDTSLSCPGCKTYVNDTTEPDAIAAAWNAANCGATPHPCPAIACLAPGTKTCDPLVSGNGPNAGTTVGASCVGHTTIN